MVFTEKKEMKWSRSVLNMMSYRPGKPCSLELVDTGQTLNFLSVAFYVVFSLKLKQTVS